MGIRLKSYALAQGIDPLDKREALLSYLEKSPDPDTPSQQNLEKLGINLNDSATEIATEIRKAIEARCQAVRNNENVGPNIAEQMLLEEALSFLEE